MTDTRPIAPLVVSVAALTVFDLASKRLAVSVLPDNPRQLPGPVDLQLTYNTGTAFGLFSGMPTIAISIATAVFIAIVVNLWRTNRAPTAPAALITAGGIANLLDRLEGGGVVDMLHTGWWPTFNLADIFITVGVAWWITASISQTDDTAERQPAQNSTARQPRA